MIEIDDGEESEAGDGSVSNGSSSHGSQSQPAGDGNVSDGSSSHGGQLQPADIAETLAQEPTDSGQSQQGVSSKPSDNESSEFRPFDDYWQDPLYCPSGELCRKSGQQIGMEHRCIGCGLFCHKPCGNKIICEEDQVLKDPNIDYICMGCQVSNNVRIFLVKKGKDEVYNLTGAVKHIQDLGFHGKRELGSVPLKKVNVYAANSPVDDSEEEYLQEDHEAEENEETKSNDEEKDYNEDEENDNTMENEGNNPTQDDNKEDSQKDDNNDDDSESDKEPGDKVDENNNTKKKKKKKQQKNKKMRKSKQTNMKKTMWMKQVKKKYSLLV